MGTPGTPSPGLLHGEVGLSVTPGQTVVQTDCEGKDGRGLAKSGSPGRG